MNTYERLKHHLEGLPDRKPLTKKTLSDLGPPEELDAALDDLVARGLLVCATEAVYWKPTPSEWGAGLGFGPWETAKAICERDGHTMGLTPAEWANAVLLSTQVVAKPTYITDGPTRDVPFGSCGTIHFIHASARDMRLTQSLGGGAVLGMEWAQPSHPLIAVRRLAKDMTQGDFAAFVREAEGVGGWIARTAGAYRSAYGPDAVEDVLDLDREPDREGLNCSFTDAFLEHDRQREAWTEGLIRHLASKRFVGKEGGYEA